MDNAYASANPPPGPEADDADDASGSTEITIAIAHDGSITVAMEVGGRPKGDPIQAADAADALKQAAVMLRDATATAGSEHDAFAAGFGQAGPSPSAHAPAERMQ